MKRNAPGSADESAPGIVLGRRSYAVPPTRVTAYPGDPQGPVVVGSYTSIAENAEFLLGGNHRPRWVSTFPFRAMFRLPGAFEDGHPESRGPISVGSDVWIGKDVLILSGVTISDGAVVAARSVVTKDVRPYAIVAGAPATERSRRFPDEQVDELLKAAWWDWPHEEILSVVDLLSSNRVDEFLAYARNRSS